MRKALIDTDILSYFFQGRENVRNNFSSYLETHEQFSISQITWYEITKGLHHKPNARHQDSFERFTTRCEILPLTEAGLLLSAQLYGHLRSIGQPLQDMDLLIAGTAIINGLVLITNNEAHFDRIPGLDTQNWNR